MSENIPWIDILFIMIIVYTLVMGFLKGFFKEIISIAFFVVGLVVAMKKWMIISSIIRPIIGSEILSNFLSFFLILIIFMITGSFIAFIVRKIFIKGPLKFFDRMAGFVFGGIKGFVIVLILIILTIAYFPDFKLQERSSIAFYSLDITDSLAKIFPMEIYKKYRGNLEKFEAGGSNGKRI